MYSIPSSCRERISISAPDNNSTIFYPLLRVNEPGYAPVAWILGFPASFESGTGVLLHTILRGCLLASRPPEGCGERPINGLHVSNNQRPPAGGGLSVVINGGYSLGIACRIDPSLQAIGNSDSGKLTVNRRCGLIATIFLDTGLRLANNGARVLNQAEENPHSGWHHVTR